MPSPSPLIAAVLGPFAALFSRRVRARGRVLLARRRSSLWRGAPSRLHTVLGEQVRTPAGRDAQPSARIVDRAFSRDSPGGTRTHTAEAKGF